MRFKDNFLDTQYFLFKGNKCDLTEAREIPYHIADSFAQRYNMKFIETSAKESANVEKIFYDIAETLTKQANEIYSKPSGTKLTEKNLETSKIGSCCT